MSSFLSFAAASVSPTDATCGVAIGAARDQVLVHRVRFEPLDRLHADDALVLGLVGEHRRAGDVADGVDARHVGAAEPVDNDGAAIDLHPELLQPEPLDIADDADRRDHALGLDRPGPALAVLERRGDAVALLVELGHLGPGVNLDTLLLEALARQRGDLGILGRQDLRQHLDDRNVGAHGLVERGEFDPDRARSDDQERFRHAIRHHGLEIGPDELLVGLQSGKHARTRAGRDDDVLGLVASGTERALGRLALARP